MKEILLTEHNLSAFSHLIPSEYCDEIKNGSLCGVGVVEENEGVAAFICDEENELFRIRWIYVDPKYRGRGIGPWLLERRLDDARFAGALRGAVADLSMDDEEGRLEELLMSEGFLIELEDSGVYSLSLDSLANLDKLSLLECKLTEKAVIPLERADQDLRRNAYLAVKNGNKTAPLPQQLDWEQYDQTYSAFYQIHGQVQGMMLITRQGEMLSLDFVWASAHVALKPLLAYAAQLAWNTMSKTMEIVIPTVNGASARLVEKSLGISQKKVLRARLSFPAPYSAPEMGLTNSELRKIDPLALLVTSDAFSDMDLVALKGES